MIRVAIIDDHMIVRLGIKYALRQKSDFSFVGEWAYGDGAVEFWRKTRPDVLLLDIRMPDRNGIDILMDIIAEDPNARVVMLTTSEAEEDVYRSMKAGARGYIIKDSAVNEIETVIRGVAEGELCLGDGPRRLYEQRRREPSLTLRERETLELASKGNANREIGRLLGISENSVKVYMRQIFQKLGAADRAEAVKMALQRGIIGEGR